MDGETHAAGDGGAATGEEGSTVERPILLESLLLATPAARWREVAVQPARAIHLPRGSAAVARGAEWQGAAAAFSAAAAEAAERETWGSGCAAAESGLEPTMPPIARSPRAAEAGVHLAPLRGACVAVHAWGRGSVPADRLLRGVAYDDAQRGRLAGFVWHFRIGSPVTLVRSYPDPVNSDFSAMTAAETVTSGVTVAAMCVSPTRSPAPTTVQQHHPWRGEPPPLSRTWRWLFVACGSHSGAADEGAGEYGRSDEGVLTWDGEAVGFVFAVALPLLAPPLREVLALHSADAAGAPARREAELGQLGQAALQAQLRLARRLASTLSPLHPLSSAVTSWLTAREKKRDGSLAAAYGHLVRDADADASLEGDRGEHAAHAGHAWPAPRRHPWVVLLHKRYPPHTRESDLELADLGLLMHLRASRPAAFLCASSISPRHDFPDLSRDSPVWSHQHPHPLSTGDASEVEALCTAIVAP